MSVYFNKEHERWHWQFKAVVDGIRHRSSKLLPRSTTEAQARRFDEDTTAKKYAQIARGAKGGAVPRIETAVEFYVNERCPHLADGLHAMRNLEAVAPFYEGKGLDKLGAVSRAFIKANAEKPDGVRFGPATVRNHLAALRSAANYALKHHQIGSKDWILQISIPPVNNERTFFLKRSEILQLVRKIKVDDDIGRRARALVLMTFATGSRPGELCRAERDGDNLFKQKTKNGDRELVPVHARVQRYLRYWPMEHNYTTYAVRFRGARKLLGLDHIHPHDLRHSTASALASDGATLFEVGQVLGHKSLASTKRYSHLYTEAKAKLLDRLWKKEAK